MEIFEEDIQLLERFLNGKVSKEDALAQDADFEEKLSLYERSMEAIGAWGDHQLKDSLRSRYVSPEAKVRPLLNTRIWAMAAALVLLAVLMVWQFSRPRAFDPAEAFAQNYEKLQAPLSMIRDGSGTDSLILSISQSYQSGDYEQSVELLREIDSQNPSLGLTEKQAMLGYNFLELGMADSSIFYLSQIPSSFPYYFDTQWQLAMAYLKAKQPQEAQVILESLANDSNRYGKAAADLLEKIK